MDLITAYLAKQIAAKNSYNKAETDALITSVAAIGTCETAGNVAEKVVTMPQGWTLRTGSIIGVLFSNTNTASNVSLNVGGSGAKLIKSGAAAGVSRASLTGTAGYCVTYLYDGTNWVWISQSTYPIQLTQAEIDAGIDQADRFISARLLKYATDKATENVSGIEETGDDYIELKSGVRLYITDTTPTGTIPTGSVGIGF